MEIIEILDEEIYDVNKDTQNIQVSFKKILLKYSLKLIKFYYIVIIN